MMFWELFCFERVAGYYSPSQRCRHGRGIEQVETEYKRPRLRVTIISCPDGYNVKC